MTATQRRALILEYYRRVDGHDLDWVLDLFTEDARYRRADAELRSKAEIARFYRCDRRITGRHVVEHLLSEGNTIVATGVFEGRGADGGRKRVGFSDTWILRGPRVAYRQTYLSLGSAYVER